jgi:hypothetical protein
VARPDEEDSGHNHPELGGPHKDRATFVTGRKQASGDVAASVTAALEGAPWHPSHFSYIESCRKRVGVRESKME